jgi:hypothetical protein
MHPPLPSSIAKNQIHSHVLFNRAKEANTMKTNKARGIPD